MLKRALFFSTLEGKKVSCSLCSHRCLITDGAFGSCGVRENKGGVLYTHSYGDLAAVSVDPMEKKPFFHVFPGSTAFSIACFGCNFRCDFCQNWGISQRGYDREEQMGVFGSPEQIVSSAAESRSSSIAFTYTEPVVFLEYALDVSCAAREKGLLNLLVTNGYITAEALKSSGKNFDAANVDLKSFSEDFYGKFCGAKLKPVCDCIMEMRAMGIWVEITTLLIPGRNDSSSELKKLSGFIASVDKNIPWHISRFHPDYKADDIGCTPPESLQAAYEAGISSGLKYVYIGNITGKNENTFCSECGKLLIERNGFTVSLNNVDDGKCRFCRAEVAGIF